MNRNVSAGGTTGNGTTSLFVDCMLRFVAGLFISALLTATGHAYTVTQTSTAAPAGIEAQWVAYSASTASPYLFNVQANPFFQNTWNMELLGPNPNYNPQTPAPTTLEAALSLGATVYVYGFANGESNQQNIDIQMLNGFMASCSTDTLCQQVISSATATIYNLDLSTPVPIP